MIGTLFKLWYKVVNAALKRKSLKFLFLDLFVDGIFLIFIYADHALTFTFASLIISIPQARVYKLQLVFEIS